MSSPPIPDTNSLRSDSSLSCTAGDNSQKGSVRSPSPPPEAVQPQTTSITPTTEQWESPTNQVLDSVGDYIRNGIGPIEGDDLPIVGHPVTWLTTSARAAVKHMMNVYAKRVSRAAVPDGEQKRATWRNFVTRTTQKLSDMVGKAAANIAFPPWILLLSAILLTFGGRFPFHSRRRGYPM